MKADEHWRDLLEPGARGRLLAKGLARGMIWRRGQLPLDAPRFGEGLTDDLLAYALEILASTPTLAELDSAIEKRAYVIAGELLESAFRRDEPEAPNRPRYLLLAALSFELGGYAARSSFLVNEAGVMDNLNALEEALVQLVRRRPRELALLASKLRLHPGALSDEIGDGLIEYEEIDRIASMGLQDAAIVLVADFALAYLTGDRDRAATAITASRDLLHRVESLGHVVLWWTWKLSTRFMEELWTNSLWNQLDVTPEEIPKGHLLQSFIERSAAGSVSKIDLWPSQIAALPALQAGTNALLSLPTSAGKTRAAEIAMMGALSRGKKVLYTTPLRALSAHVEGGLKNTFAPLGYQVSSMYGASGIGVEDLQAFEGADIIVATPEKLDFALRQDPHVLDEIGLIVLDEGHMIGGGPREIRYEVLVQELLRRPDAGARQLVCLSAVLSDSAEATAFARWITEASPGGIVSASWRPTRQRLAVLPLRGERANLMMSIDGEESFIPGFVTTRAPRANRRRKPFPKDERELAVAACIRLVDDGHLVLMYCPQRTSVASRAREIIDLVDRGEISAFPAIPPEDDHVWLVGAEWLGEEHMAVQALRRGFAVHHGSLPQVFLREVERLVSEKHVSAVIASPTIAQGLDLPCSALIITSLYRAGNPIPATEFLNVVGRVGRAYVDLDGLTVFPVVADGKAKRKLNLYERLQEGAAGTEMMSGLLQSFLGLQIPAMLGTRAVLRARGDPWDQDPNDIWPAIHQVLETLLSHQDGLITYVENLDHAILSLVDAPDVAVDEMINQIASKMKGSLVSEQATALEAHVPWQRILESRGRYLWASSTSAVRRRAFLGGVPIATAQTLDKDSSSLLAQLARADAAFETGDAREISAAVVALAENVHDLHPFTFGRYDFDWRPVLSSWIEGQALGEIVGDLGDGVTSFIANDVVYKLTWALQAIRGQAEDENEDEHYAAAGMATTYGCPSRGAAVLLERGFASRRWATELARRIPIDGTSRDEKAAWLDQLANILGEIPDAIPFWLRLQETHASPSRRQWSRESRDINLPELDFKSGPLWVSVEGDDVLLVDVWTRMTIPAPLEIQYVRHGFARAYWNNESKMARIEVFGPAAG